MKSAAKAALFFPMNIYRMAFRVGANGVELWPTCKELGIAAITYEALSETDLSKYPPKEPRSLWAQLASSQVSSLSAVAYEMKKGDVIYVKQGPEIVGRGVVQGGYVFDSPARITDANDVDWPHTVPVAWERYFLPVKLALGSNQRATVERLKADDLKELYAAIGKNPDAD